MSYMVMLSGSAYAMQFWVDSEEELLYRLLSDGYIEEGSTLEDVEYWLK